MKLLRFIVLAGVLLAIGSYAPTRAVAASSDAATIAFYADSLTQKKAEKPPRPRPKPGPKDGGEDE